MRDGLVVGLAVWPWKLLVRGVSGPRASSRLYVSYVREYICMCCAAQNATEEVYLSWLGNFVSLFNGVIVALMVLSVSLFI